MMNIPLTAGFSPNRWRQIIDVMLEKKPGDHRIHRLRIVALQESDFNQSNRLAIGRPSKLYWNKLNTLLTCNMALEPLSSVLAQY
jgi:hypothetical protein